MVGTTSEGDVVSSQVRLGIIGIGAQGGMYAQFISGGMAPSVTLGAICDIDPAKARVVAEKYPDVPFFDDYKAMIASGLVDAVVTTIPHYDHVEVGIYALEHGMHLIGEKPAGVYTKQVKELMACAKSHPELTFAIMFNQRNNPLYQRIKEIVDNGEIGAIRRSNWIITTWWRPQGYYEQSAWRATWGGEGGGVLVNQAPHQLDLWQWICGVPKSVFAKVAYGFKRNIAVEDEVNLIADFGNGVTGSFVTAVHDIVGTDRFEILGDRGKIVVEGSKTATVMRLKDDEQALSENMTMEDVYKMFMGGFDPKSLYDTEIIEFNRPWGDQHSGVLENFARNILDGTPLIAPGADGIRGVRLANAIHLSSWLGEEVPLEFDESVYMSELNKRIEAEGKFATRD